MEKFLPDIEKEIDIDIEKEKEKELEIDDQPTINNKIGKSHNVTNVSYNVTNL